MPRVHRLLHFWAVSRRARSPKMPVLSPVNSVGVLCYAISDSQARALSSCSIKSIQAHDLGVSAQNSGHLSRLTSSSCPGISALHPVRASYCRNRSYSQPAHCPNPGLDVLESRALNLDRRARKEQCGVSFNEKVNSESRRTLSNLLESSLPSPNASLEKLLSTRSLTGFTSPLEISSLQRLASRRSPLATSSGQFSIHRESRTSNSRILHTGFFTSDSHNEGLQKLGAEPIQSNQSLQEEGNEELVEVASYNENGAEKCSGVQQDGGTTSESDGVPSEGGRVPAERRRRSPSNSSRTGGEWRDLLTVPGIGRRNMEKLVAKGIAKLDELKQLYRDKYRGHGTEKMVEFLRCSVGVHKHHATSITDFIKTSVEAEDGRTESGSRSKKRLTFCVEGNISVGKTTFLHRIANETIELRDLVEIVPEPISKWQDVGPDHFNILDAFYGDPARYAYTFQNYVFVTRMMQERESAQGEKKLRLMERSVFSDRMVFVRAVHEAKWMSDAEISIYDSWFDPVVSAMPGLVPDAFIYLRATPDTCHRRLQSRKRKEEDTVTLDYLRDLHEKHEQWLFPAEYRGSNMLSVSDWASEYKPPLSPRLKDRVLYLKGENVHSCIQKVPALILDCEPSIDFSKDIDAKAEYARQVADFFEYVQGLKDGQADAENGPGSVVLPGSSGLVGPDGSILRSSSLDAVDFRRHMSAVCL